MPTIDSPLADWLAYIEAQHSKPIDMTLERAQRVAQRLQLGKPAQHVITVAGTNGKGSTVAFIEAIARAAGWRVGAYTSPHLLAYNERVRIDGGDASDAQLVQAFAAVEHARQHEGNTVPLTYFEFGTLAALWLFERSALDLLVLEVGLGGRLDTTNIVDPDVAVITTVDLDHQEFLGNDREQIGREKAGIARAWKPLVLGDDDPPASVLRHAYAIGASAIRAGSDFFFDVLDGRRWRWRELQFALDLPMPGTLTAPVQLRNAATAIAALRALPRDLPQQAYADGVGAAAAAARLQRVERDGVEILIDVGHNPQAARALAAALQAADTPDSPGRTHAVYAALADKDPKGVAQALGGVVQQWWLAGSTAAGARGQSAQALAAQLRPLALEISGQFDDVASALAAALAVSAAGDRILVFGSFHAAAEALRSQRMAAR